MKNSIYLSYILLLLSGCAGITPDAEKEGKIYERNGVSTLLIPSDTREVYFKDSRSFERHCRAPGPDVSIESSSGISLGASIIGKSDEISETNGQSGLALGGRDPAVLLTRELMYRACELASNLNANQQTTISIYNRFLKTVEKSIKMQQLVGTASVTDSAKSSLSNIILKNQEESKKTSKPIANNNSLNPNNTINNDTDSNINTSNTSSNSSLYNSVNTSSTSNTTNSGNTVPF
jgi:hypothetical protein